MNATSELPTTISASRVAAMLGLDSRCSRLSLFLRLRGELGEDFDNEAMLQGRFYERATCEIACHKYGMTIVPGWEQVELRDGVLSGHPDFVVRDEHGKLAICEVKNPFFGMAGDEWGEPGSDEVPQNYFIQTTIYGHLFDLGDWLQRDDLADYAYIVARLHGGVQRFKVSIDPEIVAKVRKEAEAFITRIQDNNPPDPQDEEDHRNAWVVEEGKVADCDMAFFGTLKQLQAIKDQVKVLTSQESELKTQILAYAKDADAIALVDAQGNRKTVCTLSASRKFDEAACLASHPDLLTRGFAKLDTTKLNKEQKGLYEMFMRKPESAVDQTRTIRLKLPKESTDA